LWDIQPTADRTPRATRRTGRSKASPATRIVAATRSAQPRNVATKSPVRRTIASTARVRLAKSMVVSPIVRDNFARLASTRISPR
jgi:hypothetical protein